MKKILFIFAAIALSNFGFAKKVKFSVDMTGLTVNVTGVHVMGDFQVAAGYTLDFAPNLTMMNQEGVTNVYSVIVDIPAFKKYEFKFINGDLSYEAEFVPMESRVGYFFDDNRWLFVDSLKNDTTDLGAVMFGGNAPAGKSLIRFLVDVSNIGTVSSNSLHVAGNFQASPWNTKNNIMYNFMKDTFEIIAYVVNGTYEFKYYNGNTLGTSETIPASCQVNTNRGITVSKDTVLPALCFSSCAACTFAGIKENYFSQNVRLYPNPTNNSSTLELYKNDTYNISLIDVFGRTIRSYKNYPNSSLRIDKNELSDGIYYISIINSAGLKTSTKLIIE